MSAPKKRSSRRPGGLAGVTSGQATVWANSIAAGLFHECGELREPSASRAGRGRFGSKEHPSAYLVLSTSAILLVGLLFAVAAALYASVGHAGASGYLAVMALFAVSPAVMRPTALVLNIIVASIATVKFYRAGCFRWPLFWPFAVMSVPAAFVGGTITLPGHIYKTIVGAVLLYAAVRLYLMSRKPTVEETRSIPLAVALISGLVMGLLSGLTGVGGGIFLSPLLLFGRWSTARGASGAAAPFILVNSIAGILGQASAVTALPPAMAWWIVAAVTGGWIGAEYGSKRAPAPAIRQLLAAVLVIAGAKLILT